MHENCECYELEKAPRSHLVCDVRALDDVPEVVQGLVGGQDLGRAEGIDVLGLERRQEVADGIRAGLVVLEDAWKGLRRIHHIRGISIVFRVSCVLRIFLLLVVLVLALALVLALILFLFLMALVLVLIRGHHPHPLPIRGSRGRARSARKAKGQEALVRGLDLVLFVFLVMLGDGLDGVGQLQESDAPPDELDALGCRGKPAVLLCGGSPRDLGCSGGTGQSAG